MKIGHLRSRIIVKSLRCESSKREIVLRSRTHFLSNKNLFQHNLDIELDAVSLYAYLIKVKEE